MWVERQLGRQVQAIARIDALTPEVHYRPQRVQECGAAFTIGESRKAATDLAQVRCNAQADAPQSRHARTAKRRDRPDRQRDREVRAGERRGSQQEVDVRPEAAGRDEHEPLGALGEHVGELHRHATSQRVPHERRPLVAQRDEQVAQHAG